MGKRTLSVRVPLALYKEAGSPREGEMLSPEAYRLLFWEEESAECRRRAARIQGISPNSTRALVQKLTLRGFPKEVAEQSVLSLKRLGYLNEEDQLSRLVELAAKKYWPRKKLLLALLRKGYGREDALRAMERADYRDRDVAERLLEAKLPRDATEEEKQLLLAKYGFWQEA
jgi:SOS response regulatory protein OraA/RecX